MKNILVTGCSRGIGLEFVRQLAPTNVNIIATYRDKKSSGELFSLAEKFSNVILLVLDVSSQQSIYDFGEKLSGERIDIFINNAGVMGTGSKLFGQVDRESWLEVLNVNTIAPLIITQKLFNNFKLGKEKQLIFVSSKMGSIEDNSGGGSYVYRSSKAGLNQVVKSLSVDLKGQGFTVAAVHPGWVQTDMGGVNALIDVAESVYGLIEVITNLKTSDNGKFLNYDGGNIPW